MLYISFFLLNLGLGYGHVSEHLVNTDNSIGTISNTTQSKDNTTPLSVVPSQRPSLQISHDRISTENTPLLVKAHVKGLSYMNCHQYE
jgi:hypothetical protein